MVEKICPQNKQEFINVCLARSTVTWRIEEVSSDIERQLEAKGVEFDFFRWPSMKAQMHLVPLSY